MGEAETARPHDYKTFFLPLRCYALAPLCLISQSQWEELESMAPFNDQEVLDFAYKYGINPAIVIGRICWVMNNYAIKTSIKRQLN